jgi:hypothetical protein
MKAKNKRAKKERRRGKKMNTTQNADRQRSHVARRTIRRNI